MPPRPRRHHPLRWAVLALILGICTLAACGAGQNGGDALAFIRAGTLQRMQPDGSGTFTVTPGQVLGFAWSPDHHQFVVRFAAVTALPARDPFYPMVAPDVAAELGVVSIDGGNIIPITKSSSIPVRGDAWWDASGNRLFYREQMGTTMTWYLSQSDQPNEIARKGIGSSAITATAPSGILWPTGAPDAGQLAFVSDAGALMLATAGGDARTLVPSVATLLPGGQLARPLWQPHHSAVLYATAGPSADVRALWLTDLAGHTHQILSAPYTDYAWSPDGNNLLLHLPGMWGIYTAGGAPVMMWGDNGAGAVAWWSPDGRVVLARSATALTLATLADKHVTPLLTFAHPAAGMPLAGAFPLTGSPWGSDSHAFALVTEGGTWADGTALTTRATPGTGLYIVALGKLAHAPRLIDWGEHTGMSWSTPDPNTQLLAP